MANIFTPKKATPKNKRLGVSPGVRKKTAREMIQRLENRTKENQTEKKRLNYGENYEYENYDFVD